MLASQGLIMPLPVCRVSPLEASWRVAVDMPMLTCQHAAPLDLRIFTVVDRSGLGHLENCIGALPHRLSVLVLGI